MASGPPLANLAPQTSALGQEGTSRRHGTEGGGAQLDRLRSGNFWHAEQKLLDARIDVGEKALGFIQFDKPFDPRKFTIDVLQHCAGRI